MQSRKPPFDLRPWLAALLLFALSACNVGPSPNATQTVTPTTAPQTYPTLPGGTEAGQPTVMPGTTTPPPLPGDESYQDDRSGPAELIESFVNAINLRQYARVYSYWNPEIAQTTLPPYPDFEKGYADTANVQLTLGTITGDVGAGQQYYLVPVTFLSTLANSSQETYAGCYLLHLANPGIQDSIPFKPLSIEAAGATVVQPGGNPAELMAQVCQTLRQGSGEIPPAQTFDPTDISAARYLDDRSNAVQTLRSLYNAVNRHEYARAYSYWAYDNPETGLPSYEDFKKGYENTASIQLIAGKETVGAAAGNRYYKVPVVLIAKTTAGVTETYFGCYQLHLSDPGIQGVPPYNPMKIRSGNLESVPNDSNPTDLLSRGCP